MSICLLDVSGLMYRAFFGTPSMQIDGKEVGALYGFRAELNNLLLRFKGATFIATLDCAKKTFRNDIYPEYKANRPRMPEALLSQCLLIQDACEQSGCKIAKKVGYEADDIIASYVKHFQQSTDVIIVSGDKDLLQLLQFEHVQVYNPSKHRFIKNEDVIARYDVTPTQLLDLFSLMGDSADNVPGIPGIGIKTASKLINQYNSLDGLIANINRLPYTKMMQRVRDNIDKAVLSKKLIDLCYTVELDFDN